ncbi:hypothetical protein [Mucilaginibacter gotjawali]|uniref:Uncharacterized protein n=1 Tax=Mucilaginibacter gotjawali TaxID=1550579 RepID=A0A839SNM0_9SPHI|nr:hypothetical protein [Mucilaginibacter gotjawali]MBB3058928.1 hypothetical protein [Mucilaginibacter gotjawali]
MKAKTLFFIFPLVLSLITGKAFSQTKKLISVKIEWEDFNTETIVDVGCDQFKDTFKSTKQTKSLDNFDAVFEINSLLKYFTKEKLYKNIDVRGVITLNYKEKQTEYCFDQFGHFYKDGVLLSNIPLMAFIKGLINAKYAR